MARRKKIYEGTAKDLFEGQEPGTIVAYFKDDAAGRRNQKRGIITGKGVINNRISEYVMTRLGQVGIPTHFLRRLNMREQLVREVEIIPIQMMVRNLVAGSLAERFGLEEGQPLGRSIVEFYYKNNELGDPLVLEEHITAFGWANHNEIDEMMNLALRANDFMSGLFLAIGIRLVDFRLEFGRLWDGEQMRIMIADEISPDNCRLWDAETDEKLDIDRFHRDMGDIEQAYQEVARRLGILPDPDPGPGDVQGPTLVQ